MTSALVGATDGGSALRVGGAFSFGGTVALGTEGNGLLLQLKADVGSPWRWSVSGGYRGYFGLEQWKTFLDLGASMHFSPMLTVGPRVGFGVQYEISPVVGLLGGIGGSFEAGSAFRFVGDAWLGVQIRSYLLE